MSKFILNKCCAPAACAASTPLPISPAAAPRKAVLCRFISRRFRLWSLLLYVCTYVCMHVCMHACMVCWLVVCVCVCVCVCMQASMDACMHSILSYSDSCQTCLHKTRKKKKSAHTQTADKPDNGTVARGQVSLEDKHHLYGCLRVCARERERVSE